MVDLHRIAFTRRGMLALGMAFAVPPVKAAPRKVALGAIRWDAWYEPEDSGARQAVERSLDTPAWRGRAPVCATMAGKLDLGRCSTREQIDAEIKDAHRAKLSYWAFCWYGAEAPMQAAWRLYQASALQSLVNWCMIFECEGFVSGKATALPAMAELLRGRSTQTVLGGRPLLYLLHDQTPADIIKARVEQLRRACAAIHCGDPYVVMLIGAAPGIVRSTGVNAIGIYSKPDPAPPAAPYATLARTIEGYWDTLATTGQSVVPTALTGADRRPRIERPVPWEAARQRPYEGDGNYFQVGSPNEIAAHVCAMVSWIAAHQSVCPARTGLIYSWNEHDEGGSTINPSVSDGDEIVRALAKVL